MCIRDRPQCVKPQPATSIVRYFGELLPVRSITVLGLAGELASTNPMTAQLLDAKGKLEGAAITMPQSTSVTFDFSSQYGDAAGVRISSISAILTESVALKENVKPEITYDLNTQFQQALSSPEWRIVGTVGSLAYFRATSVRRLSMGVRSSLKSPECTTMPTLV